MNVDALGFWNIHGNIQQTNFDHSLQKINSLQIKILNKINFGNYSRAVREVTEAIPEKGMRLF